MAADMFQVLEFAAGINNQKKNIFGPASDNQIVHHPALLIGQSGVGLLVDSQRFEIHWHKLFQGLCRPFPFDNNLTHMRDIEQTDIVSAVQMLLHNAAAVLHGHQVASKGHHFAAGSKVIVIENGFQYFGVSRHNASFSKR